MAAWQSFWLNGWLGTTHEITGASSIIHSSSASAAATLPIAGLTTLSVASVGAASPIFVIRGTATLAESSEAAAGLIRDVLSAASLAIESSAAVQLYLGLAVLSQIVLQSAADLVGASGNVIGVEAETHVVVSADADTEVAYVISGEAVLDIASSAVPEYPPVRLFEIGGAMR